MSGGISYENGNLKLDEEAWGHLDKCFMKYGKQANQWFPIRIITLLKRQNKNPVRQLHTNKILINPRTR